MNKADLTGIISAPGKPNIMQFLFTLTEEIDCGVMYAAMQKTIKRYPYFAFRIIKTENGYDKIENDLPMNVDNFDEAREILLAHGFKDGLWLLDTRSAKSTGMISPSGFVIGLVEHKQNHG